MDLNKIANHIRNALISTFNGVEDMSGECEQASIILWKYTKDHNLTTYENNKVAFGYFKGNPHFWNIINNTYVDITIDQFGEYEWGVIKEKYKNDYTIYEYIDYSNEISLLEIADEFLSHIKQ